MILFIIEVFLIFISQVGRSKSLRVNISQIKARNSIFLCADLYLLCSVESDATEKLLANYITGGVKFFTSQHSASKKRLQFSTR